MGTLQFKNNAATTLSGTITNSQTSITVASSSGFPVLSGSDYFYATMYQISGGVEIDIEIIKVTATVGTTWTVVRGQDGTTATARTAGTTYIELRWTAASSALMLQKDNDLSDLASASTARTNLGLGSIATQAANNVAVTGGSISGTTIDAPDNTFRISDNTDSTKKIAFEVSGLTTGVTRTYTAPNASGTLALTSDLTSGYQPLDSDLTAVAGLSTNGLIARTGAGTAATRTLTAPAAGITVTNGDGVSGNPTLALANDLAAVEAMTSTGFVRRTAADTWSAAAIANGDLPSAFSGKTYEGLTLAAAATGFTIAGGTTSKTLTVSNTLTLAGTDGSTLNIGAGGTLGTAAYTASSSYAALASANTFTANQAITGDLSVSGALTVASVAVATLTGSQTLTNKTINGASNTLSNIGNSALTNSSVTVNGSAISLGGSATITAANPNALTVSTGLALNTGTTYDGSAARTLTIDSTVATLTGIQTLTNKTISGASNTLSNIGNSALTNSSVTFNGVAVALGASGTITASTTNALTVSTGLALNTGTTFDGSAARTLTIDSSVATLNGAQTLTNKTISGAANTLSNIANSSLTNSSVTFNGVAVALGSSGTITAANPNALSPGTGLAYSSGTTYDGSAARTLNVSGVPNSALANSSVTVNGVSIALGGSGSITNAATGGGTDRVFYENGQTVTTSYTLTANRNAMSAGPITINNGVTVTVPTGARWTIV